MKVPAHRIVDGGLQKARAQKSFAHALGSGGQTQYLVEWADSTSVVLKERLQILEDNGYRAFSIRTFGSCVTNGKR